MPCPRIVEPVCPLQLRGRPQGLVGTGLGWWGRVQGPVGPSQGDLGRGRPGSSLRGGMHPVGSLDLTGSPRCPRPGICLAARELEEMCPRPRSRAAWAGTSRSRSRPRAPCSEEGSPWSSPGPEAAPWLPAQSDEVSFTPSTSFPNIYTI